ncbi:MAG: glycosyltransferase [Pseudomonadota bacterium]
MKISIVTPVLNGFRYLPEAIHSINRQDYDGWEHIIVDGGSNDGSQEIGKDWAAREERARFVSAPSLGMYPSILRGFEEATGEILCWLNCDDLFTPWALSVAAGCFQGASVKWVSGLPGRWDDHGRLCAVGPILAPPRKWIKRGWFHGRFLGFLQQESMFFSRSLYETLTKTEKDVIASMELAGDFALWRMFAARTQLEIIPTTLSGFRHHGKNLSIQRLEDYYAEIKKQGAPFPPKEIARVAAYLLRLYSALNYQEVLDRHCAKNPGSHL